MSSQHVTYDFDRLIDRRHDTYSYSQKWSCAKALAKRLGVKEITDNHIALFTADMDLRCAQPILDALHATVDHGIFGYSTLDGCDAYADAIRGWFARHDKWDVDCDLMALSAGTVKALDVCVQAFTKPGDGVIIQRPVYPPFMHVVEDNERMILNNQLIRHTAEDPEGDLYYSIDFDNLEELAARPEAKMFILCNPHNPVGRVWTAEELERMAQICMKHDVLIVADEIHGDLVCEGVTMRHMAQVAPDARVITCTAVNKTFNLAGLAATNVFFSNAQDKARFEEVRGFIEPNPFAISAVIAAYNEGDDWYEQVKAYIEANFDTVIAYFADHLPDVGVRRPEGTYILWFDFEARCRKLGIDGAELHRRIYDDAQVLLQDGSNFDPEGGEFFQRMCVPTPRTMLLDACERIARVLAE
mgnify:FL=1